MICRSFALLLKLTLSRTLALVLSLTLISCATYDPEKGTYTEGSQPITMSSDPHFSPCCNGTDSASSFVGAVGVIAGFIQLNSYVPKTEKLHGIRGKCRIRKSKDTFPSGVCQRTYLIAHNVKTGHDTKVWIDDSGEFSILANDNDTFSLAAINEQDWIKSEPITAKAPCIVDIEIRK
jgi:hypothetical protein